MFANCTTVPICSFVLSLIKKILKCFFEQDLILLMHFLKLSLITALFEECVHKSSQILKKLEFTFLIAKRLMFIKNWKMLKTT